MLYPTTNQIPSTTGYILYRNIEFKKLGTTVNLFPQPLDDEGFQARGQGKFVSKHTYTYSYDYSQNLPWTWHGSDLAVDPKEVYTFRFEAYVSQHADFPVTGRTIIAKGEYGFPIDFFYDFEKKGSWQQFEYTGKPTASIVRLLLYPTTVSSPANNGYILYRNVEFKKQGAKEWNPYMDVSSGLTYQYDTRGRVTEIYRKNSPIPITKFKHDSNGNLINKLMIYE
ncbi:hypothetical protein [Paenibacillus puerhi]|uniref:hypothetical protein n=1 Tax=Paenibacillus puerhi TaxID=2692622 RepID=UPI001357A159|nr:hypothetical protein [Paenibacillus puerhi]